MDCKKCGWTKQAGDVILQDGDEFVCPQCKAPLLFDVFDKSAFVKQIGGSHYKNFTVQPIEFIHKNNLSFIQGNVIKYICRYNKEGGKGKQDLIKIKHYIDMLIEMEG